LDLIDNFPDQTFVPGRYFMWSPATRTITYDTRRMSTNNGRLALLHEIGHARLGHRIYKYDMELLRMEMEAWDIARQLAPTLGVRINEDHIASTIASYDQWLTKRATCPDCDNFSLQRGRDSYGCFVCGAKWVVNWRKDRRVKRTIISRFTGAEDDKPKATVPQQPAAA
jgi:hypothetical protein